MRNASDDRVEGRVDKIFTIFKCGYNPDASLEMEKLISELTPSTLENITPRLLHKFDIILHAKDLSQYAILNLAPLLKVAAEVQVAKMVEKLFGIFLCKTTVNQEVVTTILKKIISQIPISQSTVDSTTALLIKLITPSQPQKLELLEKQTPVAHENSEAMVQQARNPTALERVMMGRAESIRFGIQANEMAIKCDCLDILCDVLRKYGKLIVRDHKKLVSALLTQLFCKESTLRKKIATSITSLVSSLSDDAVAKRYVLEKTTIEVVSIMKTKGIESEIVRTSIEMIHNLCWAAGYHYGQYLEDTVPLLIRFSERESEIDEELVVCSFQALRSLLLTCHNEISNHCEMILDQTLRFVGYDPNLAEDKDEIVTEIDKEIYDCNDVSWRVRSAALKCLSALIVSRPEMISRFCTDAFAKLIDRSMERVFVTEIEVFNTLKELICQIKNVREGSYYMRETSSHRLFKQHLPTLMKPITRLLGHESYRIKVDALTIFDELVVVLPDCLADFVSVIPEVGKLICDESADSILKIKAALVYMRLVNTHAASAYRPDGQGMHVLSIWTAIISSLTDRHLNQEATECAINGICYLILTFGDVLKAKVPACLSFLVQQMDFDSTRQTAIMALDVIADSCSIDICCVLDYANKKFPFFLSENNYAIRRATLGALNSISLEYGDRLDSFAYDTIIAELPQFLSDSDLDTTELTLELCYRFTIHMESCSSVGSSIINKVLPQTLTLLRSSHLQGRTILALKSFFRGLVDHSRDTRFEDLLNSLLSMNLTGVAKQALFSIAQCVEALFHEAGGDERLLTLKKLTDILKDKDGSCINSRMQQKELLALLCLGEMGRRVDLSLYASIVIQSSQSPSEEIKSAASYALENIAVGNLERYLPFNLDRFDNQHTKQHLLLHSLKDVITSYSINNANFLESEKILEVLFDHCESHEEGVRNVTAECLGKIALLVPEKLIPILKEHTRSSAAFTRATTMLALKHSIVANPERIDTIIYPEISSFLNLIGDDDQHVRRASVLALSAAARNKPNLVDGLIKNLLPKLLSLCEVKKESINTVSDDSSKHVDDGVELRKAAFECVYTLLDNFLDTINPSSYVVPFLVSGLNDHDDVKIPCHVMLSKFVKKCPSAVFAVLDDLVDPLLKTITFRPKPCSGMKQKCDRNDKIIHGALTAIASLDCTSSRDHSWKFEILVSEIAKTRKLREQYFSILDRSGSINCTSRFKNMVSALEEQENEVGPSQTYKPREERSVKADKPPHIDEQGRRRSDRTLRQSILLRDFVTHF